MKINYSLMTLGLKRQEEGKGLRSLRRMAHLLTTLMLFQQPCAALESELGDQEWIHLLHDQPMYFLIGAPEVKAQFSFKLKLLAVSHFYAAYTQRVFWDLFEKSSPFRDVNYNPSFFYRFHFNGDSEVLFDVIAYEHESNGASGIHSRSWDRTGVRLQSWYRFDTGSKLMWSARAWLPYRVDAPTPDFVEYRGIYEIILTYSNFLGPSLDLDDISLRFYSGGKSHVNPFQGGRELNFRLKGKGSAFLASGIFQLFQGYGENMLEYDQSIWGMRIGIGI